MPLNAEQQARNRAKKRLREGGTYRALTDANRQQVAEVEEIFRQEQYEKYEQRRQLVEESFQEYAKAHDLRVSDKTPYPEWFVPGVEDYILSRRDIKVDTFAAKHGLAAAKHAYWFAFGSPEHKPPSNDLQWLARLARRSVAPEVPWESVPNMSFTSGVREFYTQEGFQDMNTEGRAVFAAKAGKYAENYVLNVNEKMQEKAAAHREECLELEAKHIAKVAKLHDARGRAAIAMYNKCKSCEPCKEAKKELRRCVAHEHEFERHVDTFLKD